MIWPFNRKFKDGGVIELSVKPQPEPEGDGPLFGLSPPDGTVFEVLREGREWVVNINDSETGCTKVEGWGIYYREGWGASDKNVIRFCAKEAIADYERSKLCGTYPPKDTRSIKS